jgi:DNA polymerase elongation subunit (family B)
MSKFYTCVKSHGGKIAYRGIENGRRVTKKYPFSPTLFTPSKNLESKYKSFKGDPLETLSFDSIPDAKEFLSIYKNVENFPLFGNPKFEYAWITKNFGKIIEYDTSLLYEANIDIEVAKTPEGGYASVDQADGEVLSITLEKFGKFYVWAYCDYVPHLSSVVFDKCLNERDLLTKFLEFWTADYPDSITGWNCIPINSYIWGSDQIHKINDAVQNTNLYNSVVIKKFSVSQKQVYETTLSTGECLKSSNSHVFPVRIKPKGKYSNLINNQKRSFICKDMSVEEIQQNITNGNDVYVTQIIRKNENVDYLNLSLDDCYLLGISYTDGTRCRAKNKVYRNVVSVYNTKKEILEFVHNYKKMNSTNSKIKENFIFKDGKTNRCRTNTLLEQMMDLVFIPNTNKKKLNVEELSKLSEKQFMAFLSGMIDGDGWINNKDDPHKTLGFCDYTETGLKDFAALCRWNGLFVTNSKNTLQISFFQHNEYLLSLLVLKHPEKKICTLNVRVPSHASNKSIKFMINENEMEIYVKINSVSETPEHCDMIDISTNTHYFVYDSIKTHNCEGYDIPYLVHRITKLFGESQAKKLSPWGVISSRKVTIMGREQTFYELSGINSLDYMQLFKKFAPNFSQESYALDYIANVVLKEKKTTYKDQYKDLQELYEKNPQLFIEYNIQDVALIRKMNDKQKLLELAYNLAYYAKVNPSDVFSQVRMWTQIIDNYLYHENKFSPIKNTSEEKDHSYEGAYVKEPQVGIHNWVASYDLTSLYTMIMCQVGISPDTIIDASNYSPRMREFIASYDKSTGVQKLLNKELDLSFLKEENLSFAPNGQFFLRKEKGFLPKIIDGLFAERAMYKKLALEAEQLMEAESDPEKKKGHEYNVTKYNNLQITKKVCLNSLYGNLGNQFSIYFDIRQAEAITIFGQLVDQWTEKTFNGYLNKVIGTTNVDYVIACDTDSNYLNLGPLVEKLFPKVEDRLPDKIVPILDKICKEKFTPLLTNCFKELADYLNSYEQKMEMKREGISDRGIWTSKKHYILNVYNSEGVSYNPPKIKIKGLEMLKSSTPTPCREKMRKAVDIIMGGNEDDMIAYIEKFKEEFSSLPPEEIGFPRGVNGLKKYFDKQKIYSLGTPIHVKGSLIYNHYVQDMPDYQKISDGDKIKYIYLKEPNPVRCYVIAYLNNFPRELDLLRYVDYETQFQKSFVEPLKIILDVIGWKTEKTYSLLDLMKRN